MVFGKKTDAPINYARVCAHAAVGAIIGAGVGTLGRIENEDGKNFWKSVSSRNPSGEVAGPELGKEAKRSSTKGFIPLNEVGLPGHETLQSLISSRSIGLPTSMVGSVGQSLTPVDERAWKALTEGGQEKENLWVALRQLARSHGWAGVKIAEGDAKYLAFLSDGCSHVIKAASPL